MEFIIISNVIIIIFVSMLIGYLITPIIEDIKKYKENKFREKVLKILKEDVE